MNEQLASALNRLSNTELLLIALDFDGTMAPIVPQPTDARPIPGTAEALSELTTLPHTQTALISGRSLSSLRAVATPPEATWLIASHGAERWFGPGSEKLRLDAWQQHALHQINHVLLAQSAERPGSSVEFKPAGAVFHVRQMSTDLSARQAIDDTERALRQLAETGAQIYIHHGKAVLEVSVLDANKGQGIELLRCRSQATGVLFAGDDTTDENGFAALDPEHDVGVKVGEGHSLAAYRVAQVSDTEDVLRTILAGRRRYLHAAELTGHNPGL